MAIRQRIDMKCFLRVDQLAHTKQRIERPLRYAVAPSEILSETAVEEVHDWPVAFDIEVSRIWTKCCGKCTPFRPNTSNKRPNLCHTIKRGRSKLTPSSSRLWFTDHPANLSTTPDDHKQRLELRCGSELHTIIFQSQVLTLVLLVMVTNPSLDRTLFEVGTNSGVPF